MLTNRKGIAMLKKKRWNNLGSLCTLMLTFMTIFLCAANAFAQTSNDPSKRLFKSEKSKAWSYRVDHANRILNGVEEDHSKEWAIEVLMKAVANDSSAKAMNSLGMAYMNGLGVNKDVSTAVSWMEKAAQHGLLSAYHKLGLIFKDGQHGVVQNLEKSFDFFSLGAAKGSVDCTYAKGFMLYKGLGCNQNYTEAMNCFMKAAERRHQPSLYMIGLCYRNGYGVEKNDELGKEYLYRSAMLGYTDAKEELERINTENHSQESNKDIAVTGKWKCADEFLESLGFGRECMNGQCKFKKDGTFVVKLKSKKRMNKLIIVKINGTYLLENGSISTTVNADDISCYIDPRIDYPDPIEITDGLRDVNKKETLQSVYDLNANWADTQSQKIKSKMYQFWQWKKEPARMVGNNLMIGYKAIFTKK